MTNMASTTACLAETGYGSAVQYSDRLQEPLKQHTGQHNPCSPIDSQAIRSADCNGKDRAEQSRLRNEEQRAKRWRKIKMNEDRHSNEWIRRQKG
ncbi:hypothetical protein ACQJBY_017909 [Aegilops geniculata]